MLGLDEEGCFLAANVDIAFPCEVEYELSYVWILDTNSVFLPLTFNPRLRHSIFKVFKLIMLNSDLLELESKVVDPFLVVWWTCLFNSEYGYGFRRWPLFGMSGTAKRYLDETCENCLLCASTSFLTVWLSCAFNDGSDLVLLNIVGKNWWSIS